ncbi:MULTISPECIES: DeoR/GlpR family DNA-binding transcription regulator [Rhizobium]|uniref:DeoR/GlpR transcriptional regulator n=2 Tax=Rhizobium TaxID=379 RepID=A0A387G065_9HYPH|nr:MULTISPECIES: DeoR/GlpR family DNA-binding transcription regulator [Rhizobium]AYG63943.1 DeoR/GlpR transcriptional regulator [Rhizobium jaguaris]MDL2403467.1 DeoR/GlpR family DNA-binding transcription regulator [Rhizobium mayense]
MSSSHQRRKQILSMIEATGEVRTRELIEMLGISEETVRRDLKMFERSGRVVRVHGGAVATGEPKLLALASRSTSQAGQKDDIASMALSLLKPGQNVFLGGGSTVLALARRISALPKMRIVTNMIDTCIAAAEGGRHEVSLLGGNFNADHRSVMGPLALRTLEEQLLDLAIIGVNAVDPERGFFDHEEIGQSLAATLARQAEKVVILADHTKFDVRARFRILPPQAISVLVTDRIPSARALELFGRVRVNVIWAGRKPS